MYESFKFFFCVLFLLDYNWDRFITNLVGGELLFARGPFPYSLYTHVPSIPRQWPQKHHDSTHVKEEMREIIDDVRSPVSL
jgi:hypothetical protein